MSPTLLPQKNGNVLKVSIAYNKYMIMYVCVYEYIYESVSYFKSIAPMPRAINHTTHHQHDCNGINFRHWMNDQVERDYEVYICMFVHR